MSQDNKDIPTQPSMDDILARIRTIIAEDEARARDPGRSGGGPLGGTGGGASGGTSGGPGGGTDAGAEVLELTRLLNEDGSVTELAAGRQAGGAEEGAKQQPAGSRPAAEAGQPAPPANGLPRLGPANGGPVRRPLLSQAAADSTAAAFDKVARATRLDDPQPPASPPAVPAAAGPGKTVEELTAELLRPMLQQWLDANLPRLVERLVAEELARLTRR